MKVWKEPQAKLIAPADTIGPCHEPVCVSTGELPYGHCRDGGSPFQPW